MTPEEEKELALKAEQKDIDDARRVREFLADPAVGEILRRAEKQCLADFAAADTDEKRRNVWARSKALTGFVGGLEGLLESGKLALHVRTTRIDRESRTTRTK